MLPNGDPVGAADLAPFVIEIDTPATWPGGLVDFISDIPERPESLLAEPPEVTNALSGQLIRTYHLARLTDSEIQNIFDDGLRRASPELADEKIRSAVATGDITPEHGTLRRRYSLGDDPSRRNLRDLCGTRHVLLARMRGEVYHYLEEWGGEILNMGIPRELKPDIEQPGRPAIVVATFPVLDWALYTFPWLTEALWEVIHEPDEARGCTVQLEGRDLLPDTLEAVVTPLDPIWGEWVEETEGDKW